MQNNVINCNLFRTDIAVPLEDLCLICTNLRLMSQHVCYKNYELCNV